MIERYYTESSPEKRLELLEDMISEGVDVEKNQARKELFSIRYKKKRNQYADQFMALWLLIKMYSSDATSKNQLVRAHKVIQKEMKKLSYSSNELLLEEWKHLIRLYVEICRTDKNYGSTVFGLARLDSDKIEAKILRDISHTGISFPVEIGLEDELAVIVEATKEVYEILNAEGK